MTAWALLGLMAAGETDHPAVARGIAYLTATQGDDGFWNEPRYTATGFPRVCPVKTGAFLFPPLGRGCSLLDIGFLGVSRLQHPREFAWEKQIS